MGPLEQLIRVHVQLADHPTTHGWFTCVCAICNDYKVRGGFRFDEDTVGYHCFNCGHKAIFNPYEDRTYSNNFLKIFNAFNILEEDYNKILLYALQLQSGDGKQNKPVIDIDRGPTSITLFNQFYLLSEADNSDVWANLAKYYLEDRCIDWTSYPFYLCEQGDTIIHKLWYKRVIVPAFKDNSVIFYQGRDLTDKNPKKYLSCSAEMSKVLYGFDQLSRGGTDPLYIVEGFFDAFPIDGVAVLHNELTKYQLKYLNACRRPKVVIPDRFGDGWKLAKQGLQQGWGVSIPDVGGLKDVNDAVRKYGKLYVLNTIRENIKTGVEAEVSVEKLRSYDQHKKSKKKGKATHQKKRS